MLNPIRNKSHPSEANIQPQTPQTPNVSSDTQNPAEATKKNQSAAASELRGESASATLGQSNTDLQQTIVKKTLPPTSLESASADLTEQGRQNAACKLIENFTKGQIDEDKFLQMTETYSVAPQSEIRKMFKKDEIDKVQDFFNNLTPKSKETTTSSQPRELQQEPINQSLQTQLTHKDNSVASNRNSGARTQQDLNQNILIKHKKEDSQIGGSEYTFEEITMYANLADFPYTGNRDDVEQNGWSILTTSEINQLKCITDPFAITETGLITDNHGLCAYFFKREQEGKTTYCISFGGTTAGTTQGGFIHRSSKNLSDTLKQWVANIANATGMIPELYKHAALLTGQVIDKLDKNTSLELTGHSLGGGLAQYSAGIHTSLEKQIAVHAFCSAELNKNMLRQITEKHGDNTQKVLEKIKNVRLKGDIVPLMHRVIPSLSNIGNLWTITPVGRRTTGIERHINFKDHIDNYVVSKQNKNTKIDKYRQPVKEYGQPVEEISTETGTTSDSDGIKITKF